MYRSAHLVNSDRTRTSDAMMSHDCTIVYIVYDYASS